MYATDGTVAALIVAHTEVERNPSGMCIGTLSR
jgi:hypothetical protein